MTNEELVLLYQDGENNALQELLQQNKNFVYKVARKFFIGRDNAIDQEDLIQEGYIGLIKAANKYTPDSEANFITYAYYWIYQSMHRFMYPTHAKRTNKDMSIGSINKMVGDDLGSELGDLIADEDSYPSLEDDIANKEDCHMVQEILSCAVELNERTIEIIKLRYGLEDGTTHTCEEVGEMFGISKQRVQQIEHQAFSKIRNSKWARMRNLERQDTIKNRSYDKGKATMEFFKAIDDDLRQLFAGVV